MPRQKNGSGATVGYEAELCQMADVLRASMDAAEYKHVCLGLLFFTYADNPAFNSFVDESHGVIRIFDAEFRTGEVLFQEKSESCRVYLAEFGEQADVAESAVSANGATGGSS